MTTTLENGKAMKSNIIIDFDSTFMKVEGLEELAEIVLKDSPDQAKIVNEIKAITDLGMDGKIGFNESLTRRLDLLRVNQDHLDKLVRRLKRKVSSSFSRNKAFFKKFKGRIYIISNGFKDFIDPVVLPYGIDSDHVLANTFVYDEEGWVIGFDQNNELARSKGKSKKLKGLNLDGEIMVIGDAYTDFEMVEAGIAHKFFMFTENVLRESILDKADHVTPSFDEFLYVNHMPRALSYPKNRIKVLLQGGIDEQVKKAFEAEGYQVEFGPEELSEAELTKLIKEVSILGIHGHSEINMPVLKQANRLMSIGLFDTGTGAIDLEACAKNGVNVFNAPYTNTRSQVELAIGYMIMLLRQVPKYMNVHATNQVGSPTSHEIRGRKLGIIGYGHAGSQLSVLAEAFGMDVYYYDILDKPSIGNATKCATMKELLRKAEIVSIHVDDRPENVDFFNRAAFKAMSQNSILVDLSHGHAIDKDALMTNLKSGKILGTAIDAFTNGGADKWEALREFENVILTPNIAGHTVEAQKETAAIVPTKVIDYINTGNTSESLNFPELQLPTLKNAHRLIHIHRNKPGVLAKIDSVMAKHNINILGQYLKTNDQIGYVIVDINKKYDKKVLKDLKLVEHTIKFRVLY